MIKKIIIPAAVISLALCFVQCKKEKPGDRYLQHLQGIAGTKGDRAKASGLHVKALAEHKKKNFKASEQLWYEAAKADPSWPKIYFNLACSNALQGKSETAVTFLHIALELDSENLLMPALNDGDLQSLRGLDTYKKLMKKFDNKAMKLIIKGTWYLIFHGEPISYHRITFNGDGTFRYHLHREFDATGSWVVKPKGSAVSFSGTASHTSDYDGSEVNAPFRGEAVFDSSSKTIKMVSYYNNKLSGDVTMIQAKEDEVK